MEGCYFKFVSLLEVCVLRQILVFKVNTFLLNQNIPDNHRICQMDWFLYDRDLHHERGNQIKASNKVCFKLETSYLHKHLRWRAL